MATNTTNYNLVKQDPLEFYDVAVVNKNLDKVDAALKAIDEKAENIDLSELARKEELATHKTEITQKLKDKIIITSNPPSIQNRKEGSFYFHITDANPIGTSENIQVSPMMGIKFKE